MKLFNMLYQEIDSTNKTNKKVAALKSYFAQADPKDAIWAISLLSGRKLKATVSAKNMRALVAHHSGIPEWLVEECRHTVGDTAETIALLTEKESQNFDMPLHKLITEVLLPMVALCDDERAETLVSLWKQMTSSERFVLNKLIMGAFRVGVSQKLVVRALAEQFSLPPDLISLRLMGKWEPTESFFRALTSHEDDDALSGAVHSPGRPYPFLLAYPVEGGLQALGSPDDWQVEWKWDGIRCQAIRRESQVYLWSRGEEIVTEQYPEVAEALNHVGDGTVIDGELLVTIDGKVQPFHKLQKRIGRKKVTKNFLVKYPVTYNLYDLMEFGGEDIRSEPLRVRREKLEQLYASLPKEVQQTVTLSEIVTVKSWPELEKTRTESRARNVEGVMLKKSDSPYAVGRKRGLWWKWKVDPLSIDAVLIYAQKGSGRRANLFTDYTFAVWDGEGNLVPFAKAYSGLTDKEIRVVDSFVRKNTNETFGPVRSVQPELVYEIGFEGIQPSARHKSGIAVRFPRMLRPRTDKPAAEANTLSDLHALLKEYE